jgi:hypothetical protein
MQSQQSSGADHWASLAEQWKNSGSPLRPSPEDLQFFKQSVDSYTSESPEPRRKALILGVTPEYARFAWPDGTDLTAIDRNPTMVRLVWPGSTASSESVLCADWLHAPLPERAFDFIAGDGVLSMLPFPDGYRQLAAKVAAIARPGALWSLRLFCRPDRSESPERVISELLSKKIASFHAFKLRLAMAFHGEDDARGVSVSDVWRHWNETKIGGSRVLEDIWPIEVIRTIDVWRDSPARYSFPTVETAAQILREYAELRGVFRPTYELAERCPTLSMRCPA